MRYLSSVIWLAPFAVHVGYALSTYGHMPLYLGGTAGEAGAPVAVFFACWSAMILSANLVFVFLYFRLPKLKDRMLSVPGKAYWLSTDELRQELVERLRGLIGVALFGLNVFFLAVYQSIYQANAAPPLVFVPMAFLVFFFMLLPMLVTIVMMAAALVSLARDARRDG
jgi:hypothetical protein